MPIPPSLTSQQRRDALAKGDAIRAARKQLRQAITAGEETIPAVLSRAKSDQMIGRTKIADLLKALPGYGEVRVTELLNRAGIKPARRIRGLGARQQRAIIDALTHAHSGPS